MFSTENIYLSLTQSGIFSGKSLSKTDLKIENKIFFVNGYTLKLLNIKRLQQKIPLSRFVLCHLDDDQRI